MANKHWWEEDEQKEQGEQTQQEQQGGYWWEDGSVANTVGTNITNRVNTWLKNHNNYVRNYQSRYSGRKYSYEDSFVSDSGDWLDTVSKQKSAFDTEADSILAYMDQFSSYLDAAWMKSVRDTLTSARNQQSSILEGATKDNEWWNSFGSEELVKQYGSAEDAYKYYQRSDGYSKKYEGKTSTELGDILDSLGDGEEKNWLTSHKASVYNDEMLKFDVAGSEQNLKKLEGILSEYNTAHRYYDMYQANPDAYSGSEYENIRTLADIYTQYQQRFGSQNDLEKVIHDTKLNINNAKRIQKNAELASVADSTSKTYDPEFGKYSAYVDDGETPLIPDYKDIAYDAVNGNMDASKLAVSQAWNRVSDVELQRLDAIKHMTEDEKALYNYYYQKHGYDAAEEYLDSIIDSLNYLHGEAMFKSMENKWVLEELFGIAAGFDQANSGLRSFFSGDDYIPTSATQYASGMVREDLKDVGFNLPDWMGGASLGQGVYDFTTTTANMAPSILTSMAVGAINPAAGAAVGNALMGASAAGNAYQEALNMGYDKGQARAYSTLVGASEVGLQYLLGGIGKLGGKLSGKAATSLASMFDNAYARLAVKYGTNMLSEGAEEYLQEILTPVFKNLSLGTDEEVSLITEDAIYSFLLGAISSGFMEGTGISSENGKGFVGNIRDISSKNQKNIDAVKQYGGSTKELIEEGLKSESGSESRQFAEMMKRKTGRGKEMSGYEIRSLVEANEAQFAVEDYDLAVKTAREKLTKLGESKNIDKIAKLVAKRATGQELTASEKSALVRSQFGAQVAKEMTRPVVETQSGPKSYNATYKSLEDRVGTESRFGVSESGTATIRESGKEISLANVEVVKTEDGQLTVKLADGQEVYAGDIDFADDTQAYAFSAVADIENITPAAATAIIRDLDLSKPVGAQLNGIDEAYTYGYHGYSEADLKAGQYTSNLTNEQMMSAYKLGQSARKISGQNAVEGYKQMRTAAQAATEKAIAEGKKAPKGKKLTITYNHGGGVIEDISTAKKKLGKLTDEQLGGMEAAEILHQMGIGTDFELFASYYSKTLKDEDGNPLEVFLDDDGQEQAAYAGVYMAADGKIRINLNAYSGTKGLTLNALSHELTHFIKTWSLEKYEAMAEFLVKSYGEKGVSMHQLVLKEQARLEKVRGGKEVSYGEAYDEVVANAFNRMLEDGKVMERIAEIRQMDKSLADKIIEGIKKFISRFFKVYTENQSLFMETEALMEMKEVFEQLQMMFAEALVDASDNFQASLIAKEAGLEIMPVENVTQYSYQSLAEAAGFTAVENADGTRSFTRDGKAVSEVTIEDIDNSPIGAFINFSVEMKDITEADAKRQKEMFAKICTMACKTNDFAMTMQFVGSAVFTGMKANADKQYGTTYDFPSICTKTQAVIDAMSAKMMSLGRGLKTDEIVKLYDDVFASGNPVPCPECYVFSRWIGIGGLLDNIKKYQDYYGAMDVEDVAAEYRKMKAEVSKFAEEQGISFGKAKGALTSKLTKEFNKLTEKIEKAQNQGEKVKPADLKRLEELEPMMNTVKGMTWLENVYFADSSLKKVNPKFRVPNEVLFDLNNGEVFATQYKDAWAFRTTQGAGYGKAITPYAEARLGEGVLVTNNTSNAIKGKAQGSLNNYFLNQKGKLDKQSRDALKKARLKQLIQAFIGGQRFQSTSDARYENASDYLLAALEMQAMGGMVQCYTKVDGAVPAFSAWGFSINQSLMPLNGGLDENGNVKDTPVGGMKPSVAFANRENHETAGTITIGVNDNHIRAMFKQWVRDFIIPYHASGGKADVVAEFRRIQEGKEAKGKAVRSTDYSRTQSDKILSDEVLRWQGKTDAQIQRIHEIRDARIAILTGGKPNMTVVRSNRFLSALYDKLNGGEWDGVKLAKSKVESQIFPNEFWDQTVTYEESAKITKDYLEYCEDLGFLHRFSGMIPSNGKLIPANGYNENGERVRLTDLAYKYDEKGNKTAEVEEFFWKVLTDRRMYDNNGNYLPQKVVTLNDTTADTVTGFAKNNQGREYDKAKAEALAQKIVKGEQYSSQQTDVDRITMGMTDTERTAILQKKSIVAEVYNGQAEDTIKRNKADLESDKMGLVKSALIRIGEQFGIFTDYDIADVDVKIQLSKGNIKESVSKDISPVRIAKLLPVLKTAVENAIGIESHANRYFYDDSTVFFENLLGGYVDGGHFVPVRFGLKHSTTGEATLYVIVDQEPVESKKIKAEVVKIPGTQNVSPAISRSAFKVSIANLAGFVNGKDMLRYLPDDMLSTEQKRAKWEAIAETVKKTNAKNDAKYAGFIASGNLRAVQNMVNQAAKVAGFDIQMFHETNADNIRIFDISRGDHGGTDYETPYGIFTKSSAKSIGLGGKQMPLFVKAHNTLRVENREDVVNKIPGFAKYYDQIQAIDKKYDAISNQLEDEEFDVLQEWMEEHPDVDMDDVFPIEYIAEGKPADIDYPKYLEAHEKYMKNRTEWESAYAAVAVKAKQFITDYLRSNGYDSMYFKADAGSRGRQTDSLIVLDENQVKSAEPITYDDQDNVVPISERFNQKSDDIRFSTQQTDNITNRHLLANAFEGITNGSEEYKLIQKYKGYIAELNSLENKLSEFNRQIREIRFTEGKYDAEKLRKLESEAKKIAEAINKYDQYLLSLEASKPLRKVIERERKKEAQKTKDHVKEIQQNKKVRAEQTELRHKIRKAVRDLDKLLNRGNKKLNVKEDMQNVVTKALQAADILFTDNYGTYDMLRNGIKADLSDAEEALVATCTRMLKDLDKMPTDGYDNFMARQEAENKLKTKMSNLNDVFARERKRLNNTTVSSILGELADAYASLEKSEQSYVQGAYTEAVHNFLKSLQSEVGGAIVKDMTKDQLESVYAAYKMVLTAVRTANKMFNEELKLSREQLGNAVIQEVLTAGGTHGLWTKAEIARSQADWNNTKPVWVANRIGSDTFSKLMNGLFKGQYNFAVDVEEAKQFKLEMDKKYKPRNWDTKKQYEFESSTGSKFSLDLQQIMSLYAFSKREQAYSHLLNGGFVFEGNSTVVVDKKGIKRTYIHNGATSYKLNEATLNGIINSLTAEQKAYVDEMQKYLSEVMGAKGNEVSMKLYGIQMFKEQFYFPLRSSGAYMERAKEAELKKQQGQINLVNSGFTHAVKPEAKNPIILSGFMDVWAEHCNEMSMYHSMVLPMEDFRKVYNYSTIHDEKMESASVYQTIQDAYGKAATDYIDQLYRELNAGATVDPRETPFKARISKFKKAAVMLSGSVVVQQFSSIGRAYAVIDPKYFIGTKVNSGTSLSVVEEMKKYAPVAIIKEMGGFDTGTKGSAKSYIMAETYGKGERVKGLLNDEQYRGDLMGLLPAKADELTWCAIWEAVKRETKANHSKMDVKSEEFLKLAGDRFSEVIEKTQVYDSVLARSANMRSKSAFMAMATAFMAEPTTTVNLLEDAIRSGKAKNIARAFGSVAVSILLNNALASIVYAMRDDDEDETFIEKYFQSFTSGMIDDINPMSYYPFLKDVYSLFQGYDVERADMSVIADVRDAMKRIVSLLGKDTSEMDDDELAEYYKQVNEVLMGLLDAGCSMFGVPVKNVRRDVNGIINAYNTIRTDLTERDFTWNSFWDKIGAAVKDTIPIYAWTKDRSKADKLYDAIISGDTAYVNRLKAGYKTDDAYHSAVRKVLRENDPRIHEAAQAKYEGNSAEYKRIFREIQNEGRFNFDDIMEAINSELSAIKKEIEPKSETSDYSSTDFISAILVGETSAAEAMREDIIATKVLGGKTQEEAEESFTDSVATATRNAFDSGLLDEAGVAEILTAYADMDDEEADAKVNYWAFIKEHPQYRGVLSQSNVEDYWEFGEPAEIPLDVFVQYVNGTKGLATIYDKWGDEVRSKREQVLEVIDSLPLTWQQKDALYLAAGYAESNIWDVPW